MSSRDPGFEHHLTAVDVAAKGRDRSARPGFGVRLVHGLEAERAHWFYWVPVALGLGIGIYFALPFEPSAGVAGLALGAVLALRFALRAGSPWRLALDIVALIVAGFALIGLRTAWVSAPVLDKRLGPVEVRGHVEQVEAREGRGARLTLRVARVEGLTAAQTPRRVRIRTMAQGGSVSPGDAIVVKAHLAPPAAPALPGGFDFARHAFFAGIGGVGYALAGALPDLEAGPPPLALRLSAAIQQLRQAIGAHVDRVLAGETAAIAKALLTGERGGIPEATNAAYRDSGLFHILSISGLHMAIMGGAVFFSVRFLLALFPALALRYPVKKWAALAAAAGSLAYLAISGTSFATVRSFIMITIMFVAILLDRPALALRNVALSALIILVLFPESLLDIGFQMSFAAVVALVAAYEAVRGRFGEGRAAAFGWFGWLGVFFGGIVLSTIVASAAVTPFAIYHFHKTQHYAVLANLIAVPVCNFIVMPAALGTLVAMPLGLEAGPLYVMGFGIDLMSAAARQVAGLRGAVGILPAVPTPAFALILAGGLWLALWQTRWRLFGLAPIAAGVMLAPLGTLPDVLVGRDGRLVAVRGASGQLAVMAAPRSQFEVKRWLEHDGDARSPEAAVAGEGVRCDALGCVARVRGATVSIARSAGALADDCVRADLLVLDVPAPRGCKRPKALVDFFDVRTKGAHAVYIDGPREIRIATVAGARGVRPWSRPHPWLRAGRADGAPGQHAGPGAGAGGGAGQAIRGAGRFAAPLDMLDALALPRPEVEDAQEDE